jgi:hypothetical protein
LTINLRNLTHQYRTQSRRKLPPDNVFHKQPTEPSKQTYTKVRKVSVLVALVLVLIGIFSYLYIYNPYAHHGSTQDLSRKSQEQTIKNTVVSTENTKKTTTRKQVGIALGDTTVWMPETRLNQEMTTIAKLGISWIRIDVSWSDIQPNDAAQYNWSGLDRVVKSANKHNLRILGTLAYAPAWAAERGCVTNLKCAPASDAQFSYFATQVVKRYANQGLHSWEIWNEPNLEGFWSPSPSPSAYTALLKAVYPAIKQADPSATVISGGLGPLDYGAQSIRQQDFLNAMYIDGAEPYFDDLGYHPYSYPVPPSVVENWSGWSTMSDITDNIRSIMSMHGDTLKPIWITEYGAPTNGQRAIATTSNFNLNNGPDHVSEGLQAEMLSQAVGIYQATPWLGNFFWYSYQDLGTSTSTNENFFGLLRYNGSEKPAAVTLHQLMTAQ